MKEIFSSVCGKFCALNSGTPFRRVLIQDSTIVKAPKSLFSIYSGVANGTSKACNSRIQVAIDLLTMCIHKFSIDSYSINDFKAACGLNIQSWDLIIRDRGYFTISEFTRIVEANADFISRYYSTSNYFDLNGKKVSILSLLKKKNKLDIWLYLGCYKGLKVRILAMPVPPLVSEKRAREYKKNAKHTPSANVLELLQWDIYITTVDEQKWILKNCFLL
ncbi:MAG: transposase [Bacteroidetes bacterium]|nr:transposase [Bacteroidota bacterium]